MINYACSSSFNLVVIISSSNEMHASSNFPSMRTKKVGTTVRPLYVITLWYTHSKKVVNEKIACWALIFIFRLRFPPDISIATILKREKHDGGTI